MSDQDPTSRPGSDDNRRYFTDRSSAQSGNRHRRRRGPGDPTTTGSIPIVRVDNSLPDPTIEYRTPEPAPDPSPYFEVRYRASEESTMQFTDPKWTQQPQSGQTQPPTRPPQPPQASQPAFREQPQPPREPTPQVPPPGVHRAEPESVPPAEQVFDILDDPEEVGDFPRETQVYPPVEEVHEPSFAETTDPDGVALDILDDDAPSVGGAMPARRRNKRVLIGVGLIALILVLVVGGLGLKWLGVFESRTDFDSATGSGSVLVEVPEEAAIRDVGQTLADAGVVGSKRAFVDAAENSGSGGVSAGFYDLPKGVSAKSALTMMSGADKRVGRVIIPEGLQLDSKESTGGNTRPGIFEMIQNATTITTDEGDYGVSVEQLVDAAANTAPEELGVPSWAVQKVTDLTGDHRRIEGLIASGAWEDIDPRLDAKQILRELITRSETRYTAWGLVDGNASGLDPYDTLTVASIVEAEARKEEDFPKVARVILNRLDRDQRLEMDSTANYTADVRANDLHGDAYNDENEWNTYKHKGLPLTPIGAVGDRALRATEDPAKGSWLYFVTVDEDGTTLFATTFDKHKQNRQVACRNKFLTVGCE